MDSTTHTQGPWKYHVPDSDHEGAGLLIEPVFDPDRYLDSGGHSPQVIAQLDILPNMEVDARLMAASPELLEHLKVSQSCLMKMRRLFSEDNDVLDTLNALIYQNERIIAKTEGRAND